jgi:hypothetical protein
MELNERDDATGPIAFFNRLATPARRYILTIAFLAGLSLASAAPLESSRPVKGQRPPPARPRCLRKTCASPPRHCGGPPSSAPSAPLPAASLPGFQISCRMRCRCRGGRVNLVSKKSTGMRFYDFSELRSYVPVLDWPTHARALSQVARSTPILSRSTPPSAAFS